MAIRLVAILVGLGLIFGFLADVNAGYLAGGAGSGGEGEQENVSIETGEIGIELGDLELLLAVGFPIIPYGDKNIPDDTIESECPNDDCAEKDSEFKGTEMGGYVKLGIRFFADSLFLNFIGGATLVTESDITYSAATDRYYEESSETVTNPLYGIGLGFFPEIMDWQLVFMLDYDNRRGVTGLIGFYW